MADWNFELEEKKPKRKFYRFKDLIIHEDATVIIVNKPPGMSCLEDRAEDAGVDLLKLGKKYDPEIRICHRIDKLTSGIVVFARDLDTYKHISLQFQNREVHKHYVALIEGGRNFEEHMIDYPLLTSAGGKVRVQMNTGKPSQTVVDSEEIFKNHTLLNCFPITGRTHQIRVHLASTGCPIIGDELYGGKDIMLSQMKKKYNLGKYAIEEPVNKGLMLHARGISFTLPKDEEPNTFIAPLSKGFEVCLKIIRKYGAL